MGQIMKESFNDDGVVGGMRWPCAGIATNTVSYTHVEVPLSLATDCLLMTLSILLSLGGFRN